MTLGEILVTLIAGLTLMVTIAGWFFTHRKQVELVGLTRSHTVADRDLAEFRERGAQFIRKATNLISPVAQDLFALKTLSERDDTLMGTYQEMFKRVIDHSYDFMGIRVDPDFEMFKYYLTDAKKFEDHFQNAFTDLVKFTHLMPTSETPINRDQIRLEARELVKKLLLLERLLPVVFARIENNLAKI